MSTQRHDTIMETLKAVPAWTLAVFGAITLEQWAMIVAIVYSIVQLAYLLRKWVREEMFYRRKMREKRLESGSVPLDSE